MANVGHHMWSAYIGLLRAVTSTPFRECLLVDCGPDLTVVIGVTVDGIVEVVYK